MLEINFNPFPDLITDRLILRRIADTDAEAFFVLRSDERVMQYINRPRAQTMADALDFIARVNRGIDENEGINWAICLKGHPTPIGVISFWRIIKEHYRAEVGYMLSPTHQGKGIMQEALTSILNYGFRVIGLHSVEAHVNPLNEASIKLLERNGFQREAYCRENFYCDGHFLDSAVYSLLAPQSDIPLHRQQKQRENNP
jgi:ribosomal-protein-alanine N-acetyltransferase